MQYMGISFAGQFDNLAHSCAHVMKRLNTHMYQIRSPSDKVRRHMQECTLEHLHKNFGV